MKEIYEEYAPFYSPSFDAKTFLECSENNFTKTSHIPSVKLFEQSNLDTQPSITIAIPAYKRVETLKVALDSALLQTTSKKLRGGGQVMVEIILIENVDNFNLRSPLQELLEKEYKNQLTYYRNQENLGMFGNWNRCLSLAKAKWVCILHDDDILMPDYVDKMQNILAQIPENTSLISGKSIIFYTNDADKKHKHIAPPKQDYIYKTKKFVKKILKFLCFGKISKFLDQKLPNEIIINNSINPSCLLHNKALCMKFGGYNQSFYPADDWLFHIRCASQSKTYLADFFSHKYRYDSNASFDQKTLVGTFIIYCLNVLCNAKVSLIYKKYLIKQIYRAVSYDAGVEGVKEKIQSFILQKNIDVSAITLKEKIIGKLYNIKYFK